MLVDEVGAYLDQLFLKRHHVVDSLVVDNGLAKLVEYFDSLVLLLHNDEVSLDN